MRMTNQVIRCLILVIFLFTSGYAFTQLPYGLLDGRGHDLRCESCEKLIDEKPVEALFGIHIHENGDVYFSMSDKQWFEKIFSSPTAGITAQCD